MVQQAGGMWSVMWGAWSRFLDLRWCCKCLWPSTKRPKWMFLLFCFLLISQVFYLKMILIAKSHPQRNTLEFLVKRKRATGSNPRKRTAWPCRRPSLRYGQRLCTMCIGPTQLTMLCSGLLTPVLVVAKMLLWGKLGYNLAIHGLA